MKKNVRAYLEQTPKIDASCYVDELSVVIGDVHLAANVSVWPFAVIRGDVNHIRIGQNSNVQDHAMLHVSHKKADKPNHAQVCRLFSVPDHCDPQPPQLIGKLRNPAHRSRRPLARGPGRLALQAPNHHRGCRRWKPRSAYRC